MVRDLRRLADTTFDLVIVGAGFYGAIAAWDATLRGLSVALIDKDDFGAGTSFNNLKTLHGGLRSLQALNLAQMRLFIRERRALARVAPHLVRPLPFVVPTYRHPKRSATLMRLALAITDAVSSDRNAGLSDPAFHLPAGQMLSREECLHQNPLIDGKGVTGGAMWHDYQLHNTDRMTFSFVLSADAAGAVTANYVRAMGFVRAGTRIAGVQVEDGFSKSTFAIRGRTVLNAAGPWAGTLLHTLGAEIRSPAPLLSRAMNLVVRRLPGDVGCGGLARGRFLFLVPWRHVSVLGTSHDTHHGSADALNITRWDVAGLIAEGREAFPRAGLGEGDVRLVHRGLLPMVAGDDNHVQLLRESLVVEHGSQGMPGLISMFGVRYTTARDTAQHAIDAVFRDRGDTRIPACQTAVRPVLGGDITNKARFLDEAMRRGTGGISVDTVERLALTYGTRYATVLQVLHESPDHAEPLSKECPVTAGEIVYAVRHEAAQKLSDALIRRTEAGSAGHPGRDALERAGWVMGETLGWSASRTRDEIADAAAFYRLPT